MTERTIYLAGGCFWGVEAFMRRLEGVTDTECGYANGGLPHASYEQVCAGGTGHAETVRVRYDAGQLSLAGLLAEFFTIIEPTSAPPDQYRNGIYCEDPADLPVCRAALETLAADHGEPLTVELRPLSCFYPAEEYHQDYLERHPDGFCHVDLSRFAK